MKKTIDEILNDSSLDVGQTIDYIIDILENEDSDKSKRELKIIHNDNLTDDDIYYILCDIYL